MLDLFADASAAFVVRATGAVLAFLFNVVLARQLGSQGAGLYFLALTIVTVGTVLGRLGMDNALLRFVSAYSARADWGAVKGVHRRSMETAALVSLLVALLVFATAPWLARAVFSEAGLVGPLRIMAVAILPMSIALLQGEALKGLRRVTASQMVQWAVVPAVLLVSAPALLSRWEATGAAAAYVVAAVAAAGAGTVLWHRATPQLRGIPWRFPYRDLLSSSLPLLWVSSLNMVMTWIALIVLGVAGSTEGVGIFAVVSRVSVLVSFVLVAVNTATSPRLASLFSQRRFAELELVVRQASLIAMLTAAPALLLLLIEPAWVAAWFGADFVAGAQALRILSGGQAVLVATGPAIPLLMMSGNERVVRNAITTGAALALCLNVVLIPPLGVDGAAIATGLTLPLVSVICAARAWNALKICTLPLPTFRLYHDG